MKTVDLLRLLFTVLCLAVALNSQGQLEKNHWYFGEGAAITFENGTGQIRQNNAMTEYGTSSATISDKNTGKLLFYTNGKAVWNNQHQLVPSDLGKSNSVVNDVLILENTFSANSYYLIVMTTGFNQPSNPVITYYPVVTSNNLIEVGTPTLLAAGLFTKLTAVKNCLTGGHWLITYNRSNRSFFAFDIGSKTINPEPVVSPSEISNVTIGDMVSNDAGTQLAVSGYSGNAEEVAVVLYDIDKKCGKLSKRLSLERKNALYAFGLAFSASQRFLYVTYSVGASELVQFDLNTGNQLLIASSTSNFNELQRGPDGKIYIATHLGGIPGPRIDVVHNPDLLGLTCSYESGYLDLGNGNTSNFHFPNFIQDYAQSSCKGQKPDFQIPAICLGDTLAILPSSSIPTSDFFWKINDRDSHVNWIPTIIPDSSGTYQVDFHWKVCDRWDTLKYEAQVGEISGLDLGKDTIICDGAQIELAPDLEEDWRVIWQPGTLSTRSITVSEPGIYVASITSGGCTDSDTISIGMHDGIWVDLGEEHFVCEEDRDLVVLDAGKGFAQYLWHPTGDTSQWIKVQAVDSYFVVVEDFRGCQGEDGTVVQRRCQPYLYFPSAFSPNNDGLNDFYSPIGQDIKGYHLQIYNRWGELIFESNDLSNNWDGSFKGAPSPIGQYLWKCSFEGYWTIETLSEKWQSGFLVIVR